MSAPRALGTSSPPTPPTATRQLATPVRVRIGGSQRTFEVRDQLRGLGLRWDPATHAWHGTLPATSRARVQSELGLPVQVVRPLDSFPTAPEPTVRATSRPTLPSSPRTVRDGSRTHVEARVAFPDEGDGDAAFPDSRFTVWEVTSGLPDDSREADERAAARQLRDLRARVKAARAVVSTNPGMAEILARDPSRAAWFCARFGITAVQLREGVAGVEEYEPVDPLAPGMIGGDH